MWPAPDLVARLCRALDIARKVIAAFAVDGYVDAETPANNFRPEKAIAETALLVYAASGANHIPEVAARVDEAARLLAPHARSERTLLNIALHPSVCFDFALPHILLTRLGYDDAAFDDFLKSCASSRIRTGHERPPFGSVEQRWISSLWTGVPAGRGWNADLRNSALNWPMDILGGVREDAYAITHLLMYCSDFGSRPVSLPRARSVILDEIASLLAKCLDDEDYDLAGETLMAWPLTRAPWSPSAIFAFRVLARVEDQVGILPCGTTRIDRFNRLEGEERAQYALATAYHTAYVMGLLCAASLRPGRASSTKITGGSVANSLLDRLMGFVDRDQGHWQSEFWELSESERCALAPLLLDILIAQRSRRKDYAALCELLTVAGEHGIARSPLCGQTAELLGRLSAYSQVSQPKTAASLS